MKPTVSVTATIHFLDSTSLTVSWPRRTDVDPATVATKLRNALNTSQLAFAVDDQLLVVIMSSVKYVVIDPLHSALPDTVITGASIASSSDGFELEE